MHRVLPTRDSSQRAPSLKQTGILTQKQSTAVDWVSRQTK